VTWATTVYPIANVGCVPVLVDVDLETFNTLPEEIEKAVTSKTKALMPVHLLGNPCEIFELQKIARANGLFVVEDACESTGAEYGTKKVGSIGDMGTFSFYMSHHISTIEGGMIVTDDDDYFELLKAMRAFGWIRDLKDNKKLSSENPGMDPRFLFVTHGYNFRPTEIQGGFGVHQIKRLDEFIDRRRRNAQYWNGKFKQFEDVLILPKERPDTRHVYFGYSLTVREEAPFQREQLVSYLEKKGVETRPIMAGNIEEQPVMRQIKHRVEGDLRNSKMISRRSFFFGNHNGIGPEEREFIATCITDFVNSATKR
jgi:CDP-6-deoxy-D-xylo-4-hexulose-3-dehydrase